MKIFEVTPPANNDEQQIVVAIKSGKTIANIENNLKKLNWTLLSFGNFGRVFTKSNVPYVIKISQQEDVGYEKFVSIVHTYPNKHFPKISKDIIVNSFYVYFIEKLHPMSNDILKGEMCDYCSMIDLKYVKSGYNEQKAKISAFEKTHKSLAEALEILSSIVEEDENGTLRLDLDNFNNIMQRKDGTPVIIDPFVDRMVFSAEEDWDEDS